MPAIAANTPSVAQHGRHPAVAAALTLWTSHRPDGPMRGAMVTALRRSRAMELAGLVVLPCPAPGRQPHRPALAPSAGPVHTFDMPRPDPPPGDAASRDRGRRPLALAGEATLRRRLIARDEQALVELIELASPWLLGLTQSMLRDQDEAEEVVLETFTAAWQRVGGLTDEHDALLPWLLRIARNRAIDRLRRRRRWRLKLARAEAFGELPADQVRATEVNEAAQPGWHVHESVHAALERLPPEQREVVRLAYFQGLTHSEIASRLDLPMGTVKTRLRLAFDKLRTALAPIKDWIG